MTLSCFDLRSLALFRFLLGLYVLYDIYDRTRLGKYDLAWYTSDPVDRSYLSVDDTPHGAALHAVWFYRGSVTFQTAAFAVLAVQAAMYCTGLGCNGITKTLLFVSYVSMQNRNMLLHENSDSFVRHLLFWSCFLPVSNVWSIDAYFFGGSSDSSDSNNNKKQSPGIIKTCSSLPCFAISIQIALAYWGSVFQRTLESKDSITNMWTYRNSTAVHAMLSDSFADRSNVFTDLLLTNLNLSKSLTAMTLGIEIAVPLICLLLTTFGGVGSFFSTTAPAAAATATARVGLSLVLVFYHGILLSLFHLPNRHFLGMIAAVLWIPSQFWDRNDTKQEDEATALYKKTDGDSAPATSTGTRTSSKQQKVTDVTTSAGDGTPSNPITRFLQLFWFGYMIYNWCGTRGWIPKHDDGDIGEALRLSQSWALYHFEPDMKAYHYTSITGFVTDLYKEGPVYRYDLLHYLKTAGKEEFRTQDPVHYIPAVMSDKYASSRWERAFHSMASRPNVRRGRIVCTALCALVNEDRIQRNLPPLTEVQIRWMHLKALLPPQSDDDMKATAEGGGNNPRRKRSLDSRYPRYPDTIVSSPCQVPQSSKAEPVEAKEEGKVRDEM